MFCSGLGQEAAEISEITDLTGPMEVQRNLILYFLDS